MYWHHAQIGIRLTDEPIQADVALNQICAMTTAVLDEFSRII